MSNPKSPIITFTVNLARNASESIGPITNAKDTGMLHPDRHDSDQDRGYAAQVQHDSLRSTYLPGFLTGENIIANNDGTITAYGLKAQYLKDTYTTGNNPILTVVSISSESELA